MKSRETSRIKRLGVPAMMSLGGAILGFGLAASCTTFDDAVFLPDLRSGTAPNAGPGTPPASPLGDAGPSASEPPPTYLAIEDAANLCTMVNRCQELTKSIFRSVGVPVSPSNYSDCMTWLAGPIPPTRIGMAIQTSVLSCMAKAQTCQEAGACGALEQFGPNDPRCADATPGAAPTRCADNGATAIRCNFGNAVHCDNAFFGPGSTCAIAPDGSGVCVASPTCAGAEACLGSVLDRCTNLGVRVDVDCAMLGLSCGQNPKGAGLSCLANGERLSCTGISAQCVGDVVQVCNNEVISPFNCGELGGRCASPQGTPRCVRDDDACTPYDKGVNACDGDRIHLCISGRPVDFDCASVGLTCQTPTDGLPGHCARL